MRRELTRHTKIALVCVAIWAFGLLWMWVDFHYGRGVWDITPGPIILMLAMAGAVPVLFYCVIVFLGRVDKGLSVFTAEVSPAAPPSAPHDPVDPADLLANPPADAQLVDHRGRRVVVLADGSAIGEMLNGKAQRFASLDDFRSYVGA